MIGFAQLRRIVRDAACGAIEREYEARYIWGPVRDFPAAISIPVDGRT